MTHWLTYSFYGNKQCPSFPFSSHTIAENDPIIASIFEPLEVSGKCSRRIGLYRVNMLVLDNLTHYTHTHLSLHVRKSGLRFTYLFGCTVQLTWSRCFYHGNHFNFFFVFGIYPTTYFVRAMLSPFIISYLWTLIYTKHLWHQTLVCMFNWQLNCIYIPQDENQLMYKGHFQVRNTGLHLGLFKTVNGSLQYSY